MRSRRGGPRTPSKPIQVVAEHRNVTLRPLREAHDGYTDLGQAKWAAWRHNQQLDGALPQRLGEVVSAVWAFTDPLVEREVSSQAVDSEQVATDAGGGVSG